MAARRLDENRWGCGHVDGWGCSRELDGGYQAEAAAAGWTEEPTAASCSRDVSRGSVSCIRMKEGFSRESLDGCSCGHEANAWGCDCKTEGRVYAARRKEVALAARRTNRAVAARRTDRASDTSRTEAAATASRLEQTMVSMCIVFLSIAGRNKLSHIKNARYRSPLK